LRLFGATLDAALARLCAVALAETLRLDDACASVGTAVSALVFENSGGSVAHDDVGNLERHSCVVCFADSLLQKRVERLLLVLLLLGEESKRLKVN
jgi:hypothetical protein